MTSDCHVAFSTTVRDIFDFSPGRTAIVKLKEGPGRRPKLKHRFHTALLDAVLGALEDIAALPPR
jgi:hypothetical protein